MSAYVHPDPVPALECPRCQGHPTPHPSHVTVENGVTGVICEPPAEPRDVLEPR